MANEWYDVGAYANSAMPALGDYWVPSVKTPGLSKQEDELWRYNQSLRGREQSAYDQQNQLSQLLFAQANGQGPSYAGLQLGAGLDQINRNSMNAAAGANGQNGVLARFGAMQAASQAGADANQAAAMARAKEIQDARGQLGQNLGAMAGESGNLYSNNLKSFEDSRENEIQAVKNNNEVKQKNIGSVSNGLASMFGA